MLQFSILTITTFVTLLDSTVIFISTDCFKKNIKKFIPILSIIFGIGLGIAGYYTPDVEMGHNLIEAIFIGLSAGAAATGVNQVGKQLYKTPEEKNEEIDNEVSCDETLIEDTSEAESVSTEDVPSDDED